MPIDFAAIAAELEGPLGTQTRMMVPLFERLARAVERLAEQATVADRATRAYPVLRYQGDALAVRVAVGSAPPLPTAPPPAFTESLRAGGVAFLDGLGWVGTAVEQELALPRILGTGAEALETVVASLERFASASPGMFDPRERRLSDLFGLLNLGFIGLLSSRDQLLDAARPAAELYRVYDRLLSDPPEPARRLAQMATVDVFVFKFEAKARGLLDAVLLLPAAGEVLAVIVRDGAIFAKRRLLQELRRVEASVAGLRAAAIDRLVLGMDLGAGAANWLAAAGTVVTTNVWILSVATPFLLQQLLEGTRQFAEGVTEWGQWATGLAETIRAAVEAFMGFDLLGFALRRVLPDGLIDYLPVPEITVEDLIKFVMGEAIEFLRDRVEDFLAAASGALWLLGLDEYKEKVDALAEVLHIVLTPTPFTLPPDVLPTGPLAGFPDVYQAFFGGGRREALVAAVDRLGSDLRNGVRQTLEGGATILTDLGRTFAEEADRAVTLGSVARIRQAASNAAALAEQVFGPEASALRDEVTRRRPDLLAVAFEAAVANGGFQLVGAAVPAYVGEMRRFWVPGRPPVERPTSPHILARQGRLGAVRVPRMTVRAAGRRPDGDLAVAVAGRLREEVGKAYQAGRRELVRMGGTP